MQYIKCVICGNNENTKLLYQEQIIESKIDEKLYSARRMPDRMHFRFVECLNCGLIFSNPIFNASKINLLYKKSSFTYRKETVYLGKTYINLLKRFLKKKVLTKLKLLEIGCGNGFFLKEALQIGFKDVYGIEPGKQTVDLAPSNIKKKITINIFKENLFKNNSFDVICSFHTLDHVVNPNIFLQLSRKLLKKEGVVFFIVHNTDGLLTKLLGERSPIFDIEHIYLFNSKNINRLLLNNGFRDTKVFNVNNTYPLRYWLHLFPAPVIFKKFLLERILPMRIGSIPLTISAGNIGIFAKKPTNST